MLKNGCITIDEYKATIENGEVTTVEKGSCTSSETSNFGGQVITEIPETGHTGVKAIVYLDPTDLSTECNAELAAANVNVYEVDGNTYKSPTGIKSGCMKWYTFKDENGYYTMLLDHNTTAVTAWITQADYEQTGSQTVIPSEVGITYASEKMTNGLPTGTWDTSYGTNNRGPITLLNQLKLDTQDWDKSLQLTENDLYTAEWTANTNNNYSGNQKYTINYNGYKGRLLSTEEVDEITKNETKLLQNIQEQYLDINCSGYGICSAGLNEFAWVFDYTGNNVPVGTLCVPDCTQYGCNAGNNFGMIGYWTKSSDANDYTRAWHVNVNGRLYNSTAFDSKNTGVRPVITVSKSKIGIN